jgi:hypothetical protein
VDPKFFITDPDLDPTFQWVPDPDPIFKKFRFRNRPFSWWNMIFKGPKMAFQNIIFKESLNVVHKNGQNYEITPFYGFCECLHPFSYMDPDPDPKPSSYGSGSGKSSGSLRIRIHNTVYNMTSLMTYRYSCMKKVSLFFPFLICRIRIRDKRGRIRIRDTKKWSDPDPQ